MTNKTALIAGASGQVGSYLLTMLLQSDAYSKVISVVRKPGTISHPKLEERVVDFDKPEQFQIPCDHIFCCLGTTSAKTKDREAYASIDKGYPIMLAKAGKANGATKFMVVSSMGADLNSSIFYARLKAEMEQEVQQTGIETVCIFRPSMLLGPRQEFRFGELIFKFLMRLFDVIIPRKYKGVHAQTVAKCMIESAAKYGPGNHLILNPEILDCR